MKKNRGVSMITVVITIVVILILAMVAFGNSGDVMDNTDYSKFTNNLSEVGYAFNNASIDIQGSSMLVNNKKKDEQIYNYIAKGGKKEKDFLVMSKVPDYTIIQDSANIGMDLPEMKIESGTGKMVAVKYVTTKTGEVFIWPPYEYGDKLYITETDTVDHKMQTNITVGGKDFVIELDPEWGTIVDKVIEETETPEPDYEEPSEDTHEHDFSAKEASETYFFAEATCTTSEKYYYKCLYCDEKGTETYNWGNPLDHSYGEFVIIKEGNCGGAGSKKRTCSKCSNTETVTIPKNSANHIGGEVSEMKVVATCTTVGVEEIKCKTCNVVFKTNNLDKNPNNHAGNISTEITKKATCTETGTQIEKCSACGKTTKTETIKELGHSYSDYTITTKANCVTNGVKERTCSTCNNKETLDMGVDASTHKEGAPKKETVAATCVTDGEIVSKCSFCNEVISSEKLAAKGHNFINKDATEKYLKTKATCIAAAEYYFECSICEASAKDSTTPDTYTYASGSVDKTNHVGETEEHYLAPTEEADGKKWTTCTACGEEISSEVILKISAKVVYSADDNSLRFYKNSDKIVAGEQYKGRTATHVYTGVETDEYTSTESIPWYSVRENVLKVVIEDEIKPMSTAYWFREMSNCTEIDVNKLDTAQVTNMKGMFYKCTSLKNVNVTNFDTSKATDMSYMFGYCDALTELDVAPKTVTVNGRTYTAWNTGNSKTFRGMFCSESNAYKGKITKLEVENWNTSSCEDMRGMFMGCASLTSLDLSKWDVSKVTTMAHMFSDCIKMKEYNFTGWDTSSLTECYSMFNENRSVAILDVSDFDMQNVLYFSQMFEMCYELKEIKGLENWDTSSVKGLFQMFAADSKLTQLNLTSFDTSNVTSISQMFSWCGSLKTIYVSDKWDMSSLIDDEFVVDGNNYTGSMQHAFRGCESLVGGNGTAYATTRVDYDANPRDAMYARIDEGPSNPGYLTAGIYFAYANIGVGVKSNPVIAVKDKSFENYKDIIYSIENGDEYVNINITTGQVTGVAKGVATIKVTLTNENGKKLSMTTNISISDGNAVLASGDTWFSQGGTQLKRASITEIEIKDTYIASGTNTYCIKWDASEAKDGSVMAYVEGTKLTLAGNGTGVIYANPNSSYAFSESTGEDRFKSLTTFTGGTLFNTSKATTMKSMFQHAVKLNSIDVSNWDVSKVEDMYCMFAGNASSVGAMSLTSIAVDNWNVGKVKDFSAMFQTCSSLNKINVSNWDMSSATNTRNLFRDCSSLTNINVSNWNTANINNMTSMFYGCNKIETLDVSNWNTSSVTNMSFMFNGCNKLKALDMSNFDLSKVVDISAMFQQCNALKTIGDTSNFDTSSCTLFSWMFNNCYALEEIDVSSWDVSKSTGLTSMFRNCHKLTEVKGIENWTVSTECVNMPYMFQYSNIRSLDLSGFDTSNAYMNEMFVGMSNLDTITLGEKFNFAGNGATPCVLPTPSVSGATGIWYRVPDWAEFEAADVPSNEAATYVAVKDCYLDINFILDDTWYYGAMANQANVYCVDISINGVKLTAPSDTYITVNGEKTYGFVDYFTQHRNGTSYKISNMKVGDGYTYIGMNNGSKYAGILTRNTGFDPKFKSNKYTVTFNANGGVGTMDDVTLTCHKPEVLPGNNFTKEGFGFAGWSTSPNGNIICTNGEEISNLTYVSGDTIELYAVWAEPGTLAYSDSWFTQGNSGITRSSITEIEIVGGAYTPSGVEGTDYVKWDASAGMDGSVMAYVEGTKLILAGGIDGKIYANANSSFAFSDRNKTDYFSNVTQIKNIELLDTSNTINMSNMFRDAKSLININVADWDVSNVTNMRLLFAASTHDTMMLSTLDLQNWNVSKVEDMCAMFQRCTKLTSVNITNWDTANVTDMSYMFLYCDSLTALDVATKTVTKNGTTYTAWNTGKVKTFKNMFSTESNAFRGKITKLEVENWDTSSCENMHAMFNGCASLTELDISNWDVSKVTDMAFMFADCRNMKTYDFSGWDTSNVTTINCMFNDNKSLVTLDVSDFDTQNLVYCTQVFELCDNLEKIIGLENWDTSSVGTMLQMFNNSPKIKELNLSSFDTSSLVNICQMFGNCRSLETIYVSDKWDMSNLLDNKFYQDGEPSGTRQHVFRGCEKLVGGAGTAWVKDHIDYIEGEYAYDYMYAQIDGGTENPGYLTDISNPPEPILAANTTWYSQGGTTINRNQISSITIADTYDTTDKTIVDQWDASTFSYGSSDEKGPVTAYIENDGLGNGTYKLILAGNGSGKVYANEDSSMVFGTTKENSGDAFINMTSFNGGEIFDTSRATTLEKFFVYAKSLKEINTENWNVSNVTSLYGMFAYCKSLETVNVSNWNTSKVTTMAAMFMKCHALESVDLSKWVVSNVTDMQHMFGSSVSPMHLKSVGDISEWDTSKVTTIRAIFQKCHYLEELDVSGWDVSSVTDMAFAFNACYKIESYDLSKWNTPNLTDMYATFRNNFALTTIDVSGIDTSKVTDFGRTFENASNLTEIVGLENWDTSKVTRVCLTFGGCSKLSELDLSSWDTSSVENMCAAFKDCSNLKTVYVSEKWNMSNVSDETFNLDDITSGAKHHIFWNCSNLVGGAGTAYAENHLDYSTDTEDYIYAHIDEGSSNPGYLTYRGTYEVPGLGDIKISDPNAEMTYDPDTGNLGGEIPPSEDEPEPTPNEIPEEKLPEMISVSFGRFESNITYAPGTYEDVTYEQSYTRNKYPVTYGNTYWSQWKVTKDANGNVISTEPGDIKLENIEKTYSTWIVYDFETEKYLESNGVKGDAVEVWTIFNSSDDTLENAVYLAAYLNKLDGKTTRHIAKHNGTNYVEYDADSQISAVTTFTETYVVTGTKRVEITAPSVTTNYVYVPMGELRAEKGMTWTKWLESEYNTTGETTPNIKTKDFVDVAYTDVIDENVEYGFIKYELSGTWKFNSTVDSPGMAVEENVSFMSNEESFVGMSIMPSYYAFPIVYISETGENNVAVFTDNAYLTLDFGSTPQEVSQKFYEWFTANATQQVYELTGTWKFNDILDRQYVTNEYDVYEQLINFTFEKNSYTKIHLNYTSDYYVTVVLMDESDEPYSIYFDQKGPHDEWETTWYGEKTIDFGSTPQPVSKDFYDWFTANATKFDKLQGTWVLNENVEWWESNKYYVEFGVCDNFLYGENFVSISTIPNSFGLWPMVPQSGTPIKYIGWDKTENRWGTSSHTCDCFETEHFPGGAWTIHSTIEEVTDEKGSATAGEDLYQWLLENATKINNHAWTPFIRTKEATCTETGSKERECILCGEEEVVEIAAKGHSDSNSDSVCDNCGESLIVYTLSGTWVWNDEIDTTPLEALYSLYEIISFTSNGKEYSSIETFVTIMGSFKEFVMLYSVEDEEGCVLEQDPVYLCSFESVGEKAQISEIVNMEYRTLDFGTTPQEVSKFFYEWFTANATKQEVTLITFAISAGDSAVCGEFTAEEGMTWGEWLESEYNTIGLYYDTTWNSIRNTVDNYSIHDWMMEDISDILNQVILPIDDPSTGSLGYYSYKWD